MIQFHLQSKSHQLEEHLQCLDAAESDKVFKNELSLIISMEKLSFVAEKLLGEPIKQCFNTILQCRIIFDI